jgi:hypothetical protein
LKLNLKTSQKIFVEISLDQNLQKKFRRTRNEFLSHEYKS